MSARVTPGGGSANASKKSRQSTIGSSATRGLATIAALTPPEIAVSLVDENLEPIDYGLDCDVVAISCFNVQWARAVEIAAEFRRRGRLVVIGGPYPTLCPERFDGVADVVFVGDVAGEGVSAASHRIPLASIPTGRRVTSSHSRPVRIASTGILSTMSLAKAWTRRLRALPSPMPRERR